MLVNKTPVELYEGFYVKREDLCCPPPGPSFSKMRGVVEHLNHRPEKVIGVLDTYHSKAGWAVAWACSKLGKKCINFWPHYKRDDPEDLRETQLRSREFGAELRSLPAGRSCILYHQARKQMAEVPGGYLMPNALKLSESVESNAWEALRTDFTGIDNLILSVSSGTVAAGVIKGLRARVDMTFEKMPVVVLHMGYSRSEEALREYVAELSGASPSSFLVIDEGYSYKDAAKGEAPFPCNPYYDLKAWNWLLKSRPEGRTMFWNIGD